MSKHTLIAFLSSIRQYLQTKLFRLFYAVISQFAIAFKLRFIKKLVAGGGKSLLTIFAPVWHRPATCPGIFQPLGLEYQYKKLQRSGTLQHRSQACA